MGGLRGAHKAVVNEVAIDQVNPFSRDRTVSVDTIAPRAIRLPDIEHPDLSIGAAYHAMRDALGILKESTDFAPGRDAPGRGGKCVWSIELRDRSVGRAQKTAIGAGFGIMEVSNHRTFAIDGLSDGKT